jgi:hypothetical protein
MTNEQGVDAMGRVITEEQLQQLMDRYDRLLPHEQIELEKVVQMQITGRGENTEGEL